jgi:hypothetical protein
MKNRADFLFATPGADFGVARFLDFAGAFDEYNSSASEQEADCKAIFADWLAVRDSISEALSCTVGALQLESTTR